MFAIELYRKYLFNSTKGISNKEKTAKLAFEKRKISDILQNLDELFYLDETVKDKYDTSIYTFIKRDIMSEALRRGSDIVVLESKFFLNGILNEIESMRESIAA